MNQPNTLGTNLADAAAAAISPQTELSKSEGSDTANAAVKQGDGDPAEPEPEIETRRVLAGLQIGRIVNYIMADGQIRPLIVVCAGDGTGLISGVLLFKGRDDAQRHPRGLVNDASGHLPSCCVLLQSVAYDGETFAFGTWHWPTKQPVVATSMDPHAFETMLLAAVERTIADEKRELVSLVNEKLAAQLEAVNATLDSFRSMVEGLVGGNSAARPTEFSSLDEATKACGKDEMVNVAEDGRITIVPLESVAGEAKGEQTANAAAAGSGDAASESGATQTAS